MRTLCGLTLRSQSLNDSAKFCPEPLGFESLRENICGRRRMLMPAQFAPSVELDGVQHARVVSPHGMNDRVSEVANFLDLVQ